MGRIARLIKVEIQKFIMNTVEAYYSQNQLADHYDSSGVDAPALPEDRMLLVDVEGTGNVVTAGVLAFSQGANPGERIVYSRDSDGNVKAVVRLLNDGKVEIVAPAGIKIETEDDANIEIVAKGDVSLTADGKQINVNAQAVNVNNGHLEVT